MTVQRNIPCRIAYWLSMRAWNSNWRSRWSRRIRFITSSGVNAFLYVFFFYKHHWCLPLSEAFYIFACKSINMRITRWYPKPFQRFKRLNSIPTRFPLDDSQWLWTLQKEIVFQAHDSSYCWFRRWATGCVDLMYRFNPLSWHPTG